jgi:hypothetical protein
MACSYLVRAVYVSALADPEAASAKGVINL